MESLDLDYKINNVLDQNNLHTTNSGKKVKNCRENCRTLSFRVRKKKIFLYGHIGHKYSDTVNKVIFTTPSYLVEV